MADTISPAPISIGKLILVPSIITLGISILRMVGELQGWSPILFGRAAGGGGAIIGISWLPLFLGPYFAVKLAKMEQLPVGAGRAIGFSVGGLILFFSASYLAFGSTIALPIRLTLGFILMIVAGTMTILGWPALGKTLAWYGYAARIPVVIIMFFAFRGNWGTHYDALPPDYTGPTDLFAKFIFLGVVPQLVFWVIYTIIIGALLGSIVTAVAYRKPPAVPAA